MFINLGLLFLLMDLAGMQVVFGTLLSAEICTILRFLVNDRWVFGHPCPTRRRLLQYHVANATAFGVWWGATNALNLWGIHYLLAAVMAVGCSMGFSIAANFLWIWHKRSRPVSE